MAHTVEEAGTKQTSKGAPQLESSSNDSIHDIPEHGSTVSGAIFNFTNSIVGAGAIGLGGAIAQSGGLVSILTVIFFAVLTKLSLDLVIRLSVETDGAVSYEDLGQIAFGWMGLMAIVVSKFLYSFGCLVAYVVVVKDNLGPAVRALLYGGSTVVLLENDEMSSTLATWFYKFLNQDFLVTWTVSTVVILPLCLLRDMTPLASLSAVSVVSMILIVVIVFYLYICNPNHEIQQPGGTFYENWLQVKWGFLECLGTFVFTFVSQHTVHLAFGSLQPQLRTVKTWKRVSLVSIGLSAAVSLAVGVLVYLSFWQQTESDIFQIYPAIPIIDLAKLLLCVTMLLTFPLPFFTCRELLIVFSFPAAQSTTSSPTNSIDGFVSTLQEPLLEEDTEEGILNENEGSSSHCDESNGNWLGEDSVLDLSVLSAHAVNMINSCLLPGEERQLKLPYHVALTVKLWVVVTGLAIAAPNLGDVLDLVGCATGTLIAFIFPACLAFRLQGYSDTALIILVVGGMVGIVGTIMSLKQLVTDIAP